MQHSVLAQLNLIRKIVEDFLCRAKRFVLVCRPVNVAPVSCEYVSLCLRLYLSQGYENLSCLISVVNQVVMVAECVTGHENLK